ncbi:MAG: hypothetical protein AAF488_02350 [Planctomycetota bacterium]
MADINLEAEQVVGEETEEEAAEPKRGGLFARKGLIIFGAVVVVEAIILFFVFDAINGGSTPEAQAEDAAAAAPEPTVDILERYSEAGRIELRDISIYDPSDPSPRGDRRFTFTLVLRIEAEAFQKIQDAAAINEFALDLVRDDIKEEVRSYLLIQGGHPLKNRDHQAKFGARLKAHLNDKLAPLRGKILKVDLEEFRPSKY